MQIGNEITGGVLWPLGKYDRLDNLAALLKAGHDAVKSVDGRIKVMLHIDSGGIAGDTPASLCRRCLPLVLVHALRRDRHARLIGRHVWRVGAVDFFDDRVDGRAVGRVFVVVGGLLERLSFGLFVCAPRRDLAGDIAERETLIADGLRDGLSGRLRDAQRDERGYDYAFHYRSPDMRRRRRGSGGDRRAWPRAEKLLRSVSGSRPGRFSPPWITMPQANGCDVDASQRQRPIL
ncbi:hypothetical protein OKW38_006978 [Paraburkholderia sp. MM5496-R1]